MAEDNTRAELIHAIAHELVLLGYVASARSGELLRGESEPARLVHEEVWRAVNEILAEHHLTAPS
jgi:kynureninase